MRRYPTKQNTVIEEAGVDMDVEPGAFDVEKELELCEEILRREVRNLMSESARGKLSDKSSSSLRDYIKLLAEMKDEQKEKLKNMPTEALEKLVKK